MNTQRCHKNFMESTFEFGRVEFLSLVEEVIMAAQGSSAWPRRRLQIRSVLSATMSIGWVWVAATALIPYFLIGRGRGAGSIEVFGIARTEWLSFHVWSSILIGLLTVGHVVLNRRGLTRSYRVVAGASTRSSAKGRFAGRGQRGLTWFAAFALALIVVGGSWAYAAGSSGSVGNAGSRAEAGQSVDADHDVGGEFDARVHGSGNGYRGGRGTRGG